MLITFSMVNNALKDFVIFMWDFLMVVLLFFAMAILITGTAFMFRAAFMLWFEGVDPFKFYDVVNLKVTEFLHNAKNKIKGLII